MRVIALLQTYCEERFISACLGNLIEQGVQVHLTDNGSSDQTVAIAERFLGKGLIAIEHLPRHGVFTLREQLLRKERLALELDADWYMHVDADEVRLPPCEGQTLVDAFAEVDAQGYNAVDFMEYVFVPTLEEPDHDHPGFQQTMRSYYPYRPFSPHRMNAWKRQQCRVELAWSGGHTLRFPGLRLCPRLFPMKHYLFLSLAHATVKFLQRSYDPGEVRDGWHRRRTRLRAMDLRLPARSQLRTFTGNQNLDGSRPWRRHFLEQPPLSEEIVARCRAWFSRVVREGS